MQERYALHIHQILLKASILLCEEEEIKWEEDDGRQGVLVRSPEEDDGRQGVLVHADGEIEQEGKLDPQFDYGPGGRKYLWTPPMMQEW